MNNSCNPFMSNNYDSGFQMQVMENQMNIKQQQQNFGQNISYQNGQQFNQNWQLNQGNQMGFTNNNVMNQSINNNMISKL